MRANRLASLILFILLLTISRSWAQELISELRAFAPIVNQEWIGKFDDPAETREIFLKVEGILNGTAIRQTQAIPAAGNFRSETLFFWDPGAKTIAYVRMTMNRYLFKGRVTPNDSVLVVEGTRYALDGSATPVRSELIIRHDGTFIEKGGHTILYRKK